MITVITRSCDENLYSKMMKFIPRKVTCIRETGYNEWQDASRFLHDAIEKTKGYLLICDEDCFITEWGAIENIVAEMKKTGAIFSGIPDGGVIVHRCLSWCTANPFFVIFDCDAINLEKKFIDRKSIDWHGYTPAMEKHKPSIVTGSFNHGSQEPFNGLFYWLLTIGKPLYINGTTLGDGIATQVHGINNETIAIHTWYSRDKGEANLARIESFYQMAKRLKK